VPWADHGRGVRIYDTEPVKGANPAIWISHVRMCAAMAVEPSDEVELTMVTMTFDALDPERLQSVLARYVVVSRGHPGCRNIDLALSTTQPNRFVIVQKWERPEDQQAHFDSADMVTMAEGCAGLLAAAPEIDLLEPISAHDLN
jgi:quinol monooxygenase YgiN